MPDPTIADLLQIIPGLAGLLGGGGGIPSPEQLQWKKIQENAALPQAPAAGLASQYKTLAGAGFPGAQQLASAQYRDPNLPTPEQFTKDYADTQQRNALIGAGLGGLAGLLTPNWGPLGYRSWGGQLGSALTGGLGTYEQVKQQQALANYRQGQLGLGATRAATGMGNLAQRAKQNALLKDFPELQQSYLNQLAPLAPKNPAVAAVMQTIADGEISVSDSAKAMRQATGIGGRAELAKPSPEEWWLRNIKGMTVDDLRALPPAERTKIESEFQSRKPQTWKYVQWDEQGPDGTPMRRSGFMMPPAREGDPGSMVPVGAGPAAPVSGVAAPSSGAPPAAPAPGAAPVRLEGLRQLKNKDTGALEWVGKNPDDGSWYKMTSSGPERIGAATGAPAAADASTPPGMKPVLNVRKPLGAIEQQELTSVDTTLRSINDIEAQLKEVGPKAWDIYSGSLTGAAVRAGRLGERTVLRESPKDPRIADLLGLIGRTQVNIIGSMSRMAGTRNFSGIAEVGKAHVPTPRDDYNTLMSEFRVLREQLQEARDRLTKGQTLDKAKATP